MQKKSQAALEFLTTYAWAFLVILVMIGALAYFGILNPSKILPDRCNFGTEIGCADYRIAYVTTGSDGTFGLRLKNSIGEPLILTSITVSSESSTAYSCTLSSPTLPFTWNSDTLTDFSFTSCNSAASGFVKGDKAKVLITMTYYLARSSPTYSKQVAGEVFATVT